MNFIRILIAFALAFGATAQALDVNGQLKNAQAEKLAAAPVTNVVEGRFFYDTVTHFWNYRDNSAWREFVTTAGTQVLTNKTLTTPLITTPVLNDYFDVNEESAPSTPSAGTIRVYGKSDKKVYKKDSTGLESELGGGGGSGEINVITNPNESTNWTASGAGITVATTTTSTDLPLGGVVGTAIKLTPVSGTDYVEHCWTMPESLKYRKLKGQQEQRPLSGYASGDIKLDIYSYATASCGGASTRVVLSTDSSSVTAIPNANGRFTTTFDADGSDYYGIRYTRVAGTTALNVANVVVGPGIQPQGAVVSAWRSFTPTLENATGTLDFWYRQLGDSYQINGTLTVATASGSSVTFSLPNNYNRAETPAGQAGVGSYGSGVLIDTGTTVKALSVSGPTATNVIYFIKDGESIDSLDGAELVSGDFISFIATIRIAELVGTGTVNVVQNDVEFLSDDGTNDVFGPNGSLVPNQAVGTPVSRTIAFNAPQVTDDWIVEYMDGSWPGRWTRANDLFPYHAQGTNNYGIQTFWASDTTLTVRFSSGGAVGNNATYAGNSGTSWASKFSDGDRFRVRRVSSGQTVGFGLASSTSAGLVNPYSTNGVVYSGTYTPTMSGQVNITTNGTAQQANYLRVGSIVFVTGQISGIQTTGTGTDTVVLISVPVATSNFADAFQASGTATLYDNSMVDEAAFVESTSGAQTVRLHVDTTAQAASTGKSIWYNFSYKIQ